MEVTNPDEILNELKDYFYTKSCDEEKISENDCDKFIKDINIMKLSDDQILNCANSVTLAELRNTLKLMAKNKPLGNGGLPVEFYLTFFDILGP